MFTVPKAFVWLETNGLIRILSCTYFFQVRCCYFDLDRICSIADPFMAWFSSSSGSLVKNQLDQLSRIQGLTTSSLPNRYHLFFSFISFLFYLFTNSLTYIVHRCSGFILALISEKQLQSLLQHLSLLPLDLINLNFFLWWLLKCLMRLHYNFLVGFSRLK